MRALHTDRYAKGLGPMAVVRADSRTAAGEAWPGFGLDRTANG
jgi:hypothetical protein